MFPAGAGMNRVRRAWWCSISDVPRRRGDEPLIDALATDLKLCSPQARG